MGKYFFNRLNEIDIDRQVEIKIKRLQLLLENTREGMYYSGFKDDLNIYLRFIQDDLDIEVRDFREASQRLIEAGLIEEFSSYSNELNGVVISIEEKVGNLVKNDSDE